MKLIKLISFIAILIFQLIIFSNKVYAQNINKNFGDDNLKFDKKIDQLISKMTIQEKIGQLTLFTSDMDVTGHNMRTNYLDDIKKAKVGSIFNAYTAKFTRKLQKIAIENTRLKIPLLFGYDVIHGFKTIFPIPLASSCSWDLKAIRQASKISAKESAAAGIHWTFAPMVDVCRDPRWGRVAEGGGEDPYLVSQIGIAKVKGLQGNNLKEIDTILSCPKHFVGYGASQSGRDYNVVDISKRTLWEVYLPPFKACIDAGAKTLMVAFNELNGIPCTANKYLLTTILRDTWNFNGLVVSDYTAINELVNHGIVANEKQATLAALNAGVDIDMQNAAYYNYLNTLIKTNSKIKKKIDAAVKRILRAKFSLGLFDDPYKYCDEKREKAEIMSLENLKKAREIASKSIVLLKNKNHVLPLNINKINSIALIGPLFKSKKDMLGSWHAAGNFQKAVSIYEGIKKQIKKDTKILYSKGCEIKFGNKSGFSDALKVAKASDVIILALGESSKMSGEAASRSIIRLPGLQTDLLKYIQKNTNKPIILILSNGRPLCLEKEDKLADAILETWFLGTTAGDAIADIIFGKKNPSAKLTITFPRNIGQIPIYHYHKNTGRPIDESNKYTSKYLDIENTPLYPFGYGLSYTKFKYSDIILNKKSFGKDQKLKATINIKNSGNFDGFEIVQLYIHDKVASVTRPIKKLKAFKKVFIAKGQTKKVSFTISENDLAFYRFDMSYGVEEGDFNVFIGTNSDDVKKANFRFNDTFIINNDAKN